MERRRGRPARSRCPRYGYAREPPARAAAHDGARRCGRAPPSERCCVAPSAGACRVPRSRRGSPSRSSRCRWPSSTWLACACPTCSCCRPGWSCWRSPWRSARRGGASWLPACSAARTWCWAWCWVGWAGARCCSAPCCRTPSPGRSPSPPCSPTGCVVTVPCRSGRTCLPERWSPRWRHELPDHLHLADLVHDELVELTAVPAQRDASGLEGLRRQLEALVEQRPGVGDHAVHRAAAQVRELGGGPAYAAEVAVTVGQQVAAAEHHRRRAGAQGQGGELLAELFRRRGRRAQPGDGGLGDLVQEG